MKSWVSIGMPLIKKSSLLTGSWPGSGIQTFIPAKTRKRQKKKIKQINEAYEVLSDKEREKYDRLGANWRMGEDFYPPPDMEDFQFFTGTGTTGFSDFFEAIFGSGFWPQGPCIPPAWCGAGTGCGI